MLRQMGRPLLTLLHEGRNDQVVEGLHSLSTPAILSPQGHIDPVGFIVNRGQWGSLEQPSQSEDVLRRSNLLWHVLTRCAETAVMMRAGMTIPLIERQFSAQWDFFGRGFVPSQAVRDTAYDIDLAVIDRLSTGLRNNPQSLAKISYLAAAGLDLFHRRAEPALRKYEELGAGADFGKAFGITYMQV
ncbi:hypothetical protein ROR02_19770 [Pararhodospirillum oryzae]|uniref:Uncharacterized protein n=1 Tax=Pararhodospirillum oryzae TaxID=478448 RepID=A0A512H8R3_9PROT|nr:hypothetical protein ROR02_19770 [Pararhodospirillum oryzae]